MFPWFRVGLTRFREGLYPLEPFRKEDALQVVEQIHRWQRILYEKWGTHFIHCSDEWYILAGLPLPEAEQYDGYPQLENGVGMLRLLEEEVDEALAAETGSDTIRRLSVATGLLAEPFIRGHMKKIQEKYPGIRAEVYGIVNDFFGEQITVSGLLTGQDLARQLKGKNLGRTPADSLQYAQGRGERFPGRYDGGGTGRGTAGAGICGGYQRSGE